MSQQMFASEHGVKLQQHGLSPEQLSAAQAAGIPWATLLQLIVQYGPTAVAVIKQLIDALRPPQPATP
jgi:hypothetical protein